MALNRKGFVYTLEAVLASALVLGVVLTVIPETNPEKSTQPQQQALSGLKTLDKTGTLTENLSSSEVESELEPYVPNAYNHSVSIVRSKSTSEKTSAPSQHYVNNKGSYSELQLWISSANNLNVDFNGETVLEDYSSAGYEKLPVSGSEGWLNFTGSGNLEYRLDSYSSDRETVNQSQVSVVSYLILKNGTKEIQVKLWN